MDKLRQDAERIYTAAIARSLPGPAVKRALAGFDPGPGKLVPVAVGKAAWEMAAAALESLGERAGRGVLVTKYGHSRGALPGLEIIEAGHPVPDENAFVGAHRALEAVRDLTAEDTVLFLLSGGGSALFELSELPLEELQDINRQLLASGAEIGEINTVRKRLSLVKGGRFAQACAPARVLTLVLSDVVGDRADSIASGPSCPDSSTCREARAVAEKYRLRLSERARALLDRETPKELPGAELVFCGSVRQLCQAAVETCRELGYETQLLTDSLCGEARQVGAQMAALARQEAGRGKKRAFVCGGETTVRLTGTGKGGRNQELALAAAEGLAGLEGAALFSVGSDGTDGPTDAAGGYADGGTKAALAAQGISIPQVLAENDAYHALERCGGLLKTGPTGTNVNDLTVLLIDG